MAKKGFRAEAENILFKVKQRISGDCLQTSAIVRDKKVLSALNDPNEYSGPSTKYKMTKDRWQKIQNVRGILTKEKILAAEGLGEEDQEWLIQNGIAEKSNKAHEIVIGISPGFGKVFQRTLAGHKLDDVINAICGGLEKGGSSYRIVRIMHTADTSFLGLSAAKLSGSGLGIGIQSKGTAVLHGSDRLPHMNIELFSNAPLTSLSHYKQLGFNAARYTFGEKPEAVFIPYRGESLSSQFHAKVAMIYSIETGLTNPDAKPILISKLEISN